MKLKYIALMVLTILVFSYCIAFLLNIVADSFIALAVPLVVMAVMPTETEKGVDFELTAYCSCPICCGEWADGVTFTGTQAKEGRTIAVDPTIIPLGSIVEIDGKEYIAEDIGGAIKGQRIDVYFDSHKDALKFGRQIAKVEIIE